MEYEKKIIMKGVATKIEENKLYQSDKIYIKYSCPELGYGVFAKKFIDTNEIIERVPIVPLNWRSNYICEPQIRKYLYQDSSCKCEECQRNGNRMYIVMGYGMMYNHKKEFNAMWNFDYENFIAELKATKTIESEEEIFINYGNKYFQDGEEF